MAVDKLVDSTQLESDLTSVANAIRAKTGGTADLAFPADFVSEIGSISGGGGLDWADVTEVTIGANTINNTNELSIYFTDYTYNYFVLTTAPTVQNQIVGGVRLAQSGGMHSALRYRNGSISGVVISASYDAVLVEGTKYCMLAWK